MADTNMTDFALIAKAGLILIPLNGKVPVQKGWVDRAYINDDTLQQAKRTGCNLGVRLTDEHLVIDVDPRNGGDESLARLSSAIGIDLVTWTPATRTGSGGLHLWMKKPASLDVQGKLKDFPGIDLKTKGGQVVAPGSIHPDTGGLYVLDDPFGEMSALPEFPQKLSDLVRKPSTRAERTEAPGDRSGSPGEAPGADLKDGWGVADPAEIAELLEKLNPEDFRGEAAWFPLLCAVHFASGGAARSEFLDWSARDPLYADDTDKAATRWDSLDRKAGSSTTGTLIMILREHGVVDAGFKFRAEHNAEMEDFADTDGVELVEVADADAASVKAAKPKIRVQDGRQAEMVEQATDALMGALGGQILQQNGGLVRPVVLDATQDVEGVVRFSAGTTALLPVTTNWLWLKLSQTADFYRITQQTEEKGGGQKAIRTDPPKKLAALIEDNIGALPFHTVRAMVTSPTIDLASGEVIDRPGINPRTGLLAVFDPGAFRPVRRGLGQAEAKARLDDVFQALLRGFPFDGGDRGASAAVGMSTLISAILRPTMMTCPLHAIDAAAPGTGKTMFAEISGVLTMGTKPAASSWSKDEEENEKRLGAALLQKTPVLLLDNLEAKNGDRLEGNMMNMVLTSEMVSIRVLGQHLKANLSTKVFVVATGNNLVVAGDMVRRVVKCRLDAKMAQPETRVFDFNPVEVAADRRGELVTSILEAVAAYIDAGRPCNAEVTRLGSFESWTTVQGLLKWCGWDDPAKTVAEVRATDASKNDLEDALDTWRMSFGDGWVTVDELAALMVSAQGFSDPNSVTDFEHFEAVESMAEELFAGRTSAIWIGRELVKLTGLACGTYYLDVEKGKRSTRARLLAG